MENYTSELITYLEEFTTENRRDLFHRIIENRTRYLTVVLEDIYQPQNASAVLRTCDCFGIQDIHIIENQNKYTINPEVTLGSQKWVTIKKYNKLQNNTSSALAELKRQGYRIIATTPHNNNVDLDCFDLSKGKAAFLFGTELKGLSKQAHSMADEYLSIPMKGFTESLNISVSAAIILYNLCHKLWKSNDISWRLNKEEQNLILIEWLRKSIKHSSLIIDKFLTEKE